MLCPAPETAEGLIGRAFPATEITPLPAPKPDTATGTWLSVVVPLPSSPEALRPHAQTVPPPAMARLWRAPAATFTTPFRRPDTATGVDEFVTELLPSSPNALAPHAYAVP